MFSFPMQSSHWLSCKVWPFAIAIIVSAAQAVVGQSEPTKTVTQFDEPSFANQIQPLLQKYCVRCHTAENQESGIRVDNLASEPTDRQLYLLKDIQKQIEAGAMPPADEPQPSKAESDFLLNWISHSMIAARSRNTQRNGSIRRLTVAQYRNTLKELLGLDEDLTDTLPPDAVSKDGFTNNAQSMVLSPLQVESYIDIASMALDRSIVDETSIPIIQSLRMELGRAINTAPCPDKLILGANSELLNNIDFIVTEPCPQKPFEYQPFAMRTSYDFIEGYAGNDTVRGWRKFDSIYHSVFACMRGTPGYPKGEAYEVIDEGLLLRPAIPSAEIFEVENTYGPKANFKISLRELPESGNFRVRVQAARYNDGLLLDAGTPVQEPDSAAASLELDASKQLTIAQPGIYQVDVYVSEADPKQLLQLQIGERKFSSRLLNPNDAKAPSEGLLQATAFMLVGLTSGQHNITATLGDNSTLKQVRFTRLKDDDELAERFRAFESRTPTLGVYLGLRRDCGSTLTQVGALQRLEKNGMREYIFEGAINDFPSPEVEKENVNYLAGVREIGVRSEYTDGRDMPRLLIRSIEFEGPYYSQWPPTSHRDIFIDTPVKNDPDQYARTILKAFASRAYRRPITEDELSQLMKVWQRSFAEQSDFVQSVKDSLLVVLTSPQFLFLVENSTGPESEDLDEYELASKLSFFLWNSPPDQRLMELARTNQLRLSLHGEVERMIVDRRFARFVDVFATEWLSLDKFDVVSIDRKQFPALTRDVKAQLRQEPARFLEHLFKQNLPARNLIQSEYILANEVVANYYGVATQVDSGFEFAPVFHKGRKHGGLITQAAILSGLSNGRQSNPVKRGAWLAKKIIAEPPDDPPPNVPQLKDEDGSNLTLRQKLEAHRNQKGCVKCHTGIDPWGIPLEAFDAGGLFRQLPEADTLSQLPDQTVVRSFGDLQQYLASDRIDQVSFSFMKHLASYAIGRDLTYNEVVFLQEKGLELKTAQYPARDLLHFIINSDLFLKK